ncbi:MAG: HAD-IA family hydrolase [Chloroflexota bacterium]|nr:HAD-IA family hydrolase [Chloroflexota bacterium]
MAIKAVLFDVGGVLVGINGLWEQACQVFQVQDRDVFWQLFNSAALPACRGEESVADCWRGLARQLEITVPESVLQSLWVDDFIDSVEVSQEVVEIAQALSPRYQIGIISNSMPQHSRILREMGLYRGFDPVLLSDEVGITKDDPRIFDIALEKLGTQAGETVFIDDVERFAATASGRGIHALLFRSPDILRRELEDLGLRLQ